MKRHEKLIPLSRDHHEQLLLARLIRDDAPAYKGLPTSKVEKLSYAKQFFLDHIIPHFEKENSLFIKLVNADNDEVNFLIEKQKAYQLELKKHFDSLDLDSMDATGRLLEESIRHEERQLFETTQSSVDMDQFDF